MTITNKEYFSRTAAEYRLQMRVNAEQWNQERLDGRNDLPSLIKAILYRDYAKELQKAAT